MSQPRISTVAPLVESGLDLRSFPDMPLGVARLRDSDLVAFASEKAFRAAVLLWCAAWHQVPASSLPADDARLAHYAGFGRNVKAWAKVRDEAMRGFVLCTDGRYYHTVIAEKAIEADNRRRAFRERTDKARAGRWPGNRDSRKISNRDSHEVSNKSEGKGREGKGKELEAAAGDARTREAALNLAEQVATIAGHPDPQHWPPGWCGAPLRVEAWLADPAWTTDIILAACREAMARKRDGPPHNIKFFENAIATAVARQAQPLPKVIITNPEPIHVQASQHHPAGPFGASRDDFRAARADLKAGIASTGSGGKGSRSDV